LSSNSFLKGSMKFARRTYTFPGVLIDIDAIKSSIATVADEVTYSGVDLNGVIGATAMQAPRTVTATLAASAGSYVASSTITITGTDYRGAVLVEVLTIVGTDGTETLVGTKGFATVVSILIEAQFDTSGAFSFGVQDVMLNGCGIRVGTAGHVKLGFADGNTDAPQSLAVGEYLPTGFNKLFGSSATTAQNITVFVD
jgi:hypothetical protein